jgi:hypothetical protein
MNDRRICPGLNGRGRQHQAPTYGRRLALGMASLFVAAVVWAGAALARSGETEATWGIYSADATSCNTLRSVTGVANGQIVLACNANRSTTNGRQACDVTSINDTLVRGAAMAFCGGIDGIPAVKVVTSASTPLEVGKNLSATSFGVNIGMVLNPPKYAGTPAFPTNTVDTVCTTFATGSTQGVRVCRQILPCSNATCTGSTDTSGTNCEGEAQPDLYLKTLGGADGEAACDVVRQQLKATVTGEQTPIISHALFMSARTNVGGVNSQALMVCKGYKWRCGDPSSADNGGNGNNVGSVTDYQIGFGNIQTPGCSWKTIAGLYKYVCYK